MRTLLRDANFSHSYWAEAAAYSIDTQNLIPSCWHPGKILLEAFSGKRQSVAHLCVFGAKCWAKLPTTHSFQVAGGSKLDPWSVECRLLGYASGSGNYKVQDIASRHILVSHDVVFEEGKPNQTLTSVGEHQIPIFDTLVNANDDANANNDSFLNNTSDNQHINDDHHADLNINQVDKATITTNPDEPCQSIRAPQPSQAGLQAVEYWQRECTSKDEGHDWATNYKRPRASFAINLSETDCDDHTACLAETKAPHSIPCSYKHAMSTDPERWMIPMKIEMETLKKKHTWDLVKLPPGANIMGSMWIYNIKWDGEEDWIKDKARLVGKGYTQQLGNKTWAGVTWLESVQMTAAIAATLDLKLWRIDFVGAYLNSLTKEDIYIKQLEGFVEPEWEDHTCKLIHTIYSTMQGGHNWYEILWGTFFNLGYPASHADPWVWFKKDGENYMLTDTYTDDIFGASNSDEEIEKRKEEIGKLWEIKDVGETEYFRSSVLNQKKTGTGPDWTAKNRTSSCSSELSKNKNRSELDWTELVLSGSNRFPVGRFTSAGDPQVIAGKPVKKTRRFSTHGSGSHYSHGLCRIQVTILHFCRYLQVPAVCLINITYTNYLVLLY